MRPDYQPVLDRLIRMETLLFKLAMHLGMNPKSGEPIRAEPINWDKGGPPDKPS